MDHAASADGWISVSLQTLVQRLPAELRSKVIKLPGRSAKVRVPAQTVLQQLPRGAVKVSFRDLMEASPEGIFAHASAEDSTLVELPLQEIIPQLKGGLLHRRADQRQIEVPSDVLPIFGPKGEYIPARGVSLAKQGESVRPSAPRAEGPAATPVRPLNGASVTAATPGARIGASEPTGGPLRPASVPRDLRQPNGRVAELGTGPVPTPGTSPDPERPPASVGAEVIPVPVESLMNAWPEAVRQEILQSNYAHRTLALPARDVEPALRHGRLFFTWKQIRAWLQPAPAPRGSPHDECPLELPLPVIVPLFFSYRRQVKPKKLVNLAEEIPNLFGGPQTTSAETATEGALESPPSLPAAASESAVTDETPSVDLGQIFGLPQKRHWTPVEVVERTARLEGVTGAVIAMQDGLLVAGELPADITGESFACLLPQMFARMAQFTKELSLGDPSRISLQTHHSTVLILKTGKIFFAALGRPGQSMPEAQLVDIATHLGRHTK